MARSAPRRRARMFMPHPLTREPHSREDKGKALLKRHTVFNDLELGQHGETIIDATHEEHDQRKGRGDGNVVVSGVDKGFGMLLNELSTVRSEWGLRASAGDIFHDGNEKAWR